MTQGALINCPANTNDRVVGGGPDDSRFFHISELENWNSLLPTIPAETMHKWVDDGMTYLQSTKLVNGLLVEVWRVQP